MISRLFPFDESISVYQQLKNFFFFISPYFIVLFFVNAQYTITDFFFNDQLRLQTLYDVE